jgi:HK97 family phage major capsid protein
MPEEIKSLLEQQGKAFEEFKKANDERLKAIESKGYAPADVEEKVNKINSTITDLGKQLEEVAKKANRPPAGDGGGDPVKAEHQKGVVDYIRKGEEGSLRDLEKKAMVVGADPSGGYLVGHEMEAGIDKLLMADVAMMGLSTVRTIGAASYKKRVRTSGAGYGWVGETESPSETTTPGYSMLEFTPGTIYAEPQVSQDMLEDSEFDVAAELNDAIAQGFEEGLGAAFITGNGIKKPFGFLSYSTVANASWAWGKLGYIATGSDGAFKTASQTVNPADDLINLIHTLKPGLRNGASFLMADTTLAAVRKFKDYDGAYIWQPSLQLGVPSLLLGHPVATDDNMPAVGSGTIPIAFGDFKRGYVVVQRRGITILRDPYTAKPFTKFYTTKRVGGGVQNFEAIKLLKLAAS